MRGTPQSEAHGSLARTRAAAAQEGRSARLRLWARQVRKALTGRDNPQVVTEVLGEGGEQRYLDPHVLARFTLTPLIAKLVVEGFISGLHRSPFHGFSVEFADHREYVPGDDLKYLDWFLYARTDHYYIKRYEQETNLRCLIVLDRSSSMAFGTTGLTKWDYSCFLASCLAYMMLKQQDAVGLALVGERPGVLVPTRCRGAHLSQLMRVMIQNPPAGGTDLAGSLRAIIRNVKRRSLVVLISDLIDDPDQTLRSIRLISSHKHDVIVFHVQDPAELEFTFEGSTLFRDLETGEEMEVDPAAIREGYLAQLGEVMESFRKGLTEIGIDYQPLDTRQPYDRALWGYLQRRSALMK
jgi:uncharacterized protein (DUF58 family)